MKIAIFHNFLDNIGGAEIVALTLARELGADFYTTNVDPKKVIKMGFEDLLPRIYSVGKVPINAPLRQQMTFLRFRFLKLRKKYDFYIIDGDWAMSAAVNHHPNLWFIHSPIREIWDLAEYTKKNTVPRLLRPFYDLWVRINRYYNRKYSQSVDIPISNSINTQNRVKKFLKINSGLIYPPINTSDYQYRKGQGYWLAVNRLISHKRVDLQLKAFSRLPKEKLIIVGSYEQSKHFRAYANYCKKIKPKNVEILSWVDRDKLLELYSSCKGFITTSLDEDFGMTPVEAMASGKPVIAPNEGGYKETVVNNRTGVLIDDIDENKLFEAIKRVGKNPEKYKEACLKQARKFDVKRFIEEIKKEIKNGKN
ncbi:glycosyltransferase [Candidatus Pacearchaeota archaeon]|nr:glycosyltransferase [Candidatus Pacearchaeota archaeon]